jgi:hypothetical protein
LYFKSIVLQKYFLTSKVLPKYFRNFEVPLKYETRTYVIIAKIAQLTCVADYRLKFNEVRPQLDK